MSHASDLIETDIEAYLEQHERKEILRFLTCGSVDDGKSTLIGRLLHDSRMIYEDQLEAIRQDSRTIGTQRGGVDLALLVDGLQAEREQGITIDVAYRYFSTARRKFIIADTPGHEQYTRNMVTGASTCDVAIILIDANNGVLPQTRRHSYIAQLLGIRHLIVAVNKMDDVSYEEPVFDAIRDEYFAFASKLPVDDLDFIPLSALLGDNVVEQSANMPWYQGATLMHLLETIPVAAVRDTERLRMPVQYVNRPDADFRGYCGSIVGGVARPGDAITVLPSGRASTIARIVTADGDVEEAFPPMAVTLTLNDAVDISRGDVIAGEGQLPHTADRLDATVVWMAEEPLAKGKPYVIKHGARKVMGQIDAVRYHTDINTLAREPANTLSLNEIGRCSFSLAEPLVFDAYANNRDLGALILIDRVSNATVGAAMIHSPGGSTSGDAWEEEPHGDFHTSPSRVTPNELETRLRQRPVTVLFTGLAKAGKTAIARAVERRLFDQGQLATVFDGQSFRLGLSRDLGFSARDRSENMRRAAEAARLVNEAGLICLTAFVVPQESVRERARRTIGEDRFLEVFVTAPLEVLKERDEDGLYAAAERGEAPNFPGVTAPFEEPAGADLILNTDEVGLEESAERVVALLRERGFIFYGAH